MWHALFVMKPFFSQNGTAQTAAVTGLAAVGATAKADSMIHHLLDHSSVEEDGHVSGVILGLLESSLGVEVLDGVHGDSVNADSVLSDQAL